MMATLETRAMAAGVTRLHLLVIVTNLPAIKLYLQMGYEIEGLLREHFVVGGQAMNAYFMGRRLGASGDR
jgi:ribosomal protein S18 acetylase RimI-like enzyme